MTLLFVNFQFWDTNTKLIIFFAKRNSIFKGNFDSFRIGIRPSQQKLGLLLMNMLSFFIIDLFEKFLLY